MRNLLWRQSNISQRHPSFRSAFPKWHISLYIPSIGRYKWTSEETFASYGKMWKSVSTWLLEASMLPPSEEKGFAREGLSSGWNGRYAHRKCWILSTELSWLNLDPSTKEQVWNQQKHTQCSKIYTGKLCCLTTRITLHSGRFAWRQRRVAEFTAVPTYRESGSTHFSSKYYTEY